MKVFGVKLQGANSELTKTFQHSQLLLYLKMTVFSNIELYSKAKKEAEDIGDIKRLLWLSERVDPKLWLKSKGFDPNHHLSSFSNAGPCGMTAMRVATLCGEIGVCKWIVRLCGANVIKKATDCAGVTPFMIACHKGYLFLAKWFLLQVGPEVIRDCSNHGNTAMFWACSGGHIEVARWLHSSGCLEEITQPNSFGATPLWVAAANRRHDVVLWLVLLGVACDSAGGLYCTVEQLDPLLPQNFTDSRSALEGSLSLIIDQHATFTTVLLPAVAHGGSCLRALQGHEGGLLRTIADFTGVESGKRIRIARQVLGVLLQSA